MKKFKFKKVSIIVLTIVFTLGLVGLVRATTPTTVNLGTAANFAVLAGAAISDAAPSSSSITGNVGLHPNGGASITGLLCAKMQGTSKIYDNDGNYTGNSGGVLCRVTDTGGTGILTPAKNALTVAYKDARDRLAPTVTPLVDITTNSFSVTGTTLAPGIYKSDNQIGITGTLTLNGGGDPNSVFIFQAPSTLTTAVNSVVTLTNGAQACNVFWAVGSSATLGTTSTFSGTIMAKTSITDNNGSTVVGRLLADADNTDADLTGAVTLHGTHVTVPTCVVPHLTVIKHVIGGPESVTASNFTTTISGVNTTGQPATGVESPGVDNILTSLGDYTVTEGSHTGYTDAYEGCTGTISLESPTHTCTITNTYQTPTLTLDKIVVGGSSAESAWTLAADGLTPISGPGATDSADVVSDDTFLAGTYTLSESAGPANYTASAWSCVINDDAPVIGSSVVIAPNDDVVCTITNTYHAPSSGGGGYIRPPVAVFLPSINIISTPVVIAPIIPKLPKTGYPREERSTMLPIVLLSGLSLVSIFLYFAQKKQTT